MLTKRMLKIIKILSRDQQSKSSRKICAELGITSRTLRNDIKTANKIIPIHGFIIQSKHGVGYMLEIKDENLYYQFIKDEVQNLLDEQLIMPNHPEDRVHYIIRRLLVAKNYLTIDSLSEELFVSRSTLDNDMKAVREELSYFYLKLESKPSHGIKIIGSEFHRRSCISMHYFSMDGFEEYEYNNYFNQEKIQQDITKILYETIEKKEFKLTNIGFESLIIHLVIAVSRLKESIEDDLGVSDYDIMKTYEFEVAESLSEKLEKRFNLKFPLIEQIYIAMHLSGKRESQYLDSSVISMNNYTEIFKEFLIQIKKQFSLDLSNDFNLFTSLALHFQPMKSRLEYGIQLQNPLLDQIKLENPIVFDISVIMATILEIEWGYEISEDEIGYIALHVALSMENYQTENNKKNILIVCASGAGSSQILYHRVLKKFRNSIDTIKVIELYALEVTDISSYDILLSTVPLQKKYNIPTIHVKYFLSNKNILQIDSAINAGEKSNNIYKFFSEDLFFSNLESTDREGIILEMCKNIRTSLKLPEEFEEEVIKREKYAATEYGNNVAIPHPMQPITNETFVAIGILPRPILWDEYYVRYVFLLSISTNKSEELGLLHEVLASFTTDEKSLAKFDRKPNMSTFTEIITNLYNENKGNDIDSIFN